MSRRLAGVSDVTRRLQGGEVGVRADSGNGDGGGIASVAFEVRR